MRKLLPLILVVAACSGPQKATINITQRTFVMPIIIYLLGDEVIETTSITRKALEDLAGFRYFDQLPDSITTDGYSQMIATSGDSNFLPPEVITATEQYLLLERLDIELLKTSGRSIQLMFFGTTTDILKKQEAISKFVSSITTAKRVAIFDYTMRQAYNAEAWQKVRTESFLTSPPNINDHIVFHVYREGEYCRLVSLGMSKFGLPDLSVSNITCYDETPFSMIGNAIAQTLFEDPSMFSDSTLLLDISKIKNVAIREMLAPTDEANKDVKGKAMIKLREAYPSDGDNLFFQMELVFENKDYKSPQEEQFALLKDLVGGLPDQAQETEHDEELLRASEQARERLPELKKMFNDGLAPGETIMVKSPFKREDVDGNEWMWVEVTKWTDTEIDGILQNEPNYIRSLAAGANVKVAESEVFDYIIMKADGSMEGNETGKVLEQRMGNN